MAKRSADKILGAIKQKIGDAGSLTYEELGSFLGDDLDIELVRSNQFLCHYDDFANWAEGRSRLVMEDFYRWQRRRLDLLLTPDGEPEGGRWNLTSAAPNKALRMKL